MAAILTVTTRAIRESKVTGREEEGRGEGGGGDVERHSVAGGYLRGPLFLRESGR